MRSSPWLDDVRCDHAALIAGAVADRMKFSAWAIFVPI